MLMFISWYEHVIWQFSLYRTQWYIILNLHFTFSYVKQSTQEYVTKIKWTTICHKIHVVNMKKLNNDK